jgi:hypothetical protein
MTTARKYQLVSGVGLLLMVGLSLWPGDIINRFRAREWHTKGVSAVFASDWMTALESFKFAAAARPADDVLQRDYATAQEKWLRSLDEKIARLPPEERWKFFETPPLPALRKQLSEPLASEHRAFIAQNLELVRENMRAKFIQADELLESGEIKQAQALIDGMKTAAAAFEGFAEAEGSFERSLAVRDLRGATGAAAAGDWVTAQAMLTNLGDNPRISAEERADLAYRIAMVQFSVRVNHAAEIAGSGEVVRGLVLLDEAAATVPQVAALDGFNRAFSDLPAAERPARLSIMIDAARLTIRQRAAPNYARRLAEEITAHQGARAQATLDEYGVVLGRKFRTTGEQLVTESDFGRFCSELEEVGILEWDETHRIRSLQPLIVVERLRSRFAAKQSVQEFLAKGYRDVGAVLTEEGRFALAMYVLELARRESGQRAAELEATACAGLARKCAFTLYLVPTAKGSKGPVSLVNACRAAIRELLAVRAGNWITLREDLPANPAAAFYQLRTELKGIDGTKESSAQAYSGQYQSGTENVANPDYESLKSQLEQAQNEYNNQAQANANTQAIYSAAGTSGSNNVAIALTNAVASAALQNASNRVNQLNNQLANTPSVVTQPVYAEATYQVFTHRLTHHATFTISLEANNKTLVPPVSTTAEFAYKTQESPGDRRLRAPAIRPQYVNDRALAEHLAQDLASGLVRESPTLLKLVSDMTLNCAWVITHKSGEALALPDESISEVTWGFVALWQAAGYRVASYADQESALRLTLGLPAVSGSSDVPAGSPSSPSASH